MQQITGLVSQLTVLMQALQGVITNLQAGLPANNGFPPSAYAGYQQQNTPSVTPPSSSRPNSSSDSMDLPPIPTRDPDSSPTPPPTSPRSRPRESAPAPAPERTPAPAPEPPKSDPAPAPAPAPAPSPNQGGARPVKPMGELTPNAWRDPNGLSEAEKQAVCGPVAAIAFVRFTGREMSIDEAVKIARPTGWDTSGMNGPDHEVQLLDKMGVKTVKEEKVDWEHVKREVAAGRPVIIDTPQHYYVVEGYNKDTGEFNFGQSAAIKRAHGDDTWLKPEQLSVSGGARSAIYLA